MHYVLLVYSANDDRPRDELSSWERSSVDRMRATDEMMRRGILLDRRSLYGSDSATTIHLSGEQVITSDETSTPPGEHLTGYYLVDVEDLDQAIEAATLIPDAETGWIEIRPVVQMSGINE